MQDLPDGNYHALKKSGAKAKGKPHKEFMTALLCALPSVHDFFRAVLQSPNRVITSLAPLILRAMTALPCSCFPRR